MPSAAKMVKMVYHPGCRKSLHHVSVVSHDEKCSACPAQMRCDNLSGERMGAPLQDDLVCGDVCNQLQQQRLHLRGLQQVCVLHNDVLRLLIQRLQHRPHPLPANFHALGLVILARKAWRMQGYICKSSGLQEQKAKGSVLDRLSIV